MLSKMQKEQLKKPCPLCKGKLTAVGDLADHRHDLIMCLNEPCDYVMFFDGSLMN